MIWRKLNCYRGENKKALLRVQGENRVNGLDKLKVLPDENFHGLGIHRDSRKKQPISDDFAPSFRNQRFQTKCALPLSDRSTRR